MNRFIPVIISAILAGACSQPVQEKEDQTLMEASKQELATALGDREQLISLMCEITSATDRIKHLENVLTVANAHTGENKSQRAQILGDIAAIQKTLRQRRQQLAELETKLKNSAMFSQELQNSINAMHSQIERQTTEIESLRGQLTAANQLIGDLNTTVDSLNTAVLDVSEELNATQSAAVILENELNTCYYVVAPKAQLKEHKILETGFLRKTKLMKGDFDRGFFVISDKRNIDTLDMLTEKARLLTSHPEGSYTIIEHDGRKTLYIVSPDRFWNLSNYLVVQTD